MIFFFCQTKKHEKHFKVSDKSIKEKISRMNLKKTKLVNVFSRLSIKKGENILS